MNAPDKIYRSYFYDTASELYQSSPATDADSLTVYIRKDLLLEWLTEKDAACVTNLAHTCFKAVIDKINSL